MLIRSVIFSLAMILLTVLFATTSVLFRPFPFIVTSLYLRVYAYLVINSLRFICGIHYDVQGIENIPKSAFIIFSKHQSTWEPYALQTIFSKVCYVVKRELLFIPFFGWGLAAMRPIAINRGSGKQAVDQIIEKGTQRLKSGISVVIFPEGTRTAANKPGKYKIGGALLAAASGYPVVPVAHNAGECWPRGRFVKRSGTIHVRIGPAIETREKSAEQIQSEAKSWIESQMPLISRAYENA